jgi:threonylcarbamoyladenosine tRNA methylthiotransferase MtaB
VKYSVVTFGCRVNQADSLGFEEDLLARGAVPVAPDEADLILVNTCSVTATADQGARQTIRRIARDNPAARIVVTGCYATRRPDEVGRLPNVVRVVSNDDKPRLIPLLAAADALLDRSVRLQPDVSTAERFGRGDGACGAALEPGVAGRTSFTLRVQTGCAEHCSYCIIPATRGAPRSVAVQTVLSDVDRVVAAGFKEVALTGVHLGSYGRDLSPASSLVVLLHALEERFGRSVRLQPDVLFRISSLEPMDCSREVVDLVEHRRCFAPHFHLPLQHASNRILTAMGRPYTIEYFQGLVQDIRARMPHASIGSDVIVGFPGETEQDFEDLVAYLERSPLTHIHVFPYSDRPGTAATSRAGKVPGTVIRERGRRVRDVGARLADRFRQSQVGGVRPALTIDDGSTVVTDNYLKVRIPPGRDRNEFVRVRILSGHEGELQEHTVQLSVGVLRT